MKTIIFCITVIIAEVFGYGYLLGMENREKLETEVDKLNHQVVMLQSENSKLQWQLNAAATFVTEEEWENIRNN